jgi:preprotein translocase subunit SecD
VTRAVITGTENNREEAGKEKLRLESTLRSGKLPVRMEIEKVDTITQTAGRDLINSTILVAIASVIAVGVIVSLRYRDYKIVVPMVLVSLSEVVVVVGMATSQILAAVVIAAGILIGLWKREVVGILGWVTLLIMVMAASTVAIATWTIDIPVIAGLIAIMGTGVNQMIIMTDQLVREKGRALNERHKSAMHIIWSSAAIVVFAMIPLILGGIGALKGFAIATIIGVFVGILVTRPAYVAIIERIKKLHMEV